MICYLVKILDFNARIVSHKSWEIFGEEVRRSSSSSSISGTGGGRGRKIICWFKHHAPSSTSTRQGRADDEEHWSHSSVNWKANEETPFPSRPSCQCQYQAMADPFLLLLLSPCSTGHDMLRLWFTIRAWLGNLYFCHIRDLLKFYLWGPIWRDPVAFVGCM